MKRRAILGNRKLQLFTKRFFPAGNYTWTVPPGCTEVDVFLVGAGAGGKYAGGGAGYTKTLKKDATGWRDGGAISVNPGELINITVGKGGQSGVAGGYSEFKNSSYRANGGGPSQPSSHPVSGGDGGSGGGAYGNDSTKNNRGVDGGNGKGSTVTGHGASYGGVGQGHTTRAFGESNGELFASGGYAVSGAYAESVVKNTGNGGNGDGLGGNAGADGIVLIRYWAYEE